MLSFPTETLAPTLPFPTVSKWGNLTSCPEGRQIWAVSDGVGTRVQQLSRVQ